MVDILNSNNKRDLILEAALKLFIEQGIPNTSTAAISKEAGVATGTLFLYFKTKNDLIDQLYLNSKTKLAAYIARKLPVGGKIKDTLQQLWIQAIEWAMENYTAFRFIHLYRSSTLISEMSKAEAATASRFVIDLLQEGIRKGELVPADMDLVLTIIDNQLAATVNYLYLKQPKNRKKIVLLAFDLMWGGIGSTKVSL